MSGGESEAIKTHIVIFEGWMNQGQVAEASRCPKCKTAFAYTGTSIVNCTNCNDLMRIVILRPENT